MQFQYNNNKILKQWWHIQTIMQLLWNANTFTKIQYQEKHSELNTFFERSWNNQNTPNCYTIVTLLYSGFAHQRIAAKRTNFTILVLLLPVLVAVSFGPELPPKNAQLRSSWATEWVRNGRARNQTQSLTAGKRTLIWPSLARNLEATLPPVSTEMMVRLAQYDFLPGNCFCLRRCIDITDIWYAFNLHCFEKKNDIWYSTIH